MEAAGLRKNGEVFQPDGCWSLTKGDISPTLEKDKEGDTMPTISYFYGIIIVMYLRNKEHNPPHIHAITQDFDAPFLVATGELME